MSYSLVFHRDSQTDIVEAIQWYNSEKEDLGFEFYKALNAKLDLLVKQPLHYSIRFKKIRASKVAQYPYLIYFKSIEEKATLLIIAVLHTSRDPKIVKQRT